MTGSWEEALAELRELYLREAGGRLDELERSLDVLAADGSQPHALQDVRRGFHAFTGSGATYGMPAVSTIALEGERRCTGVGSGPAVRSDVECWREALVRLRGEISSAAASDRPAPAHAPKAEPATPPPPMVALIVGDPAERQALARALEQEGFAIRALAGAAEAAPVLASGRLPDAVVVEAGGTGEGAASGFELIERLRAQPGGDRPVVLVVSAHAGVLDRVEAIHCGADGHFRKPVDRAALVRRLRFLLDRERAAPARILSMDDDPHQAVFLRTVLTSAGYEFRGVMDPARLESELASFRPDLVLMDVLLPEVSGYDLVRSLRQDERYATLPVIILTTQGELDARIEAARAGGDEHLVKPVSPSLLLATVAARVERGRLLRTLVERDGLTGLLTHTALLERARGAVSRKRRDPDRQWTLTMIDIDRFKNVNDTHGHPTGDQVLVRLSGLLRARLRQADLVGRYGGEEFAVVLEDLSAPEAARLVERLRADFASIEHRPREGEPFRVTISAGLAALEEADDLSSWVHAADAALYSAKNGGRDRVVVAPPRGPSPGTA